MCWFVHEWDVGACMYMHVFMHGIYLCMNLFFNHYMYSLVINEWVLINWYVCMCMLVYVRVGVYVYVSVCTCGCLACIYIYLYVLVACYSISNLFGEIRTQLQKTRTRFGFVSLWTRHTGDSKTDA